MLINTVLLFLQSALPMFIIVALLLSRIHAYSASLPSIKHLIIISILSCLLVYFLSINMEKSSQTFGGKGNEILFSFGFILIYLISVGLFLFNNKKQVSKVKLYLAAIVFVSVLTFNGSHFILYLNGYTAQQLQFESLLIGIILGVGICASFSILFYFLLRYCDGSIHSEISGYFLLLFAVGQLMQSIVLLQQVDILPTSQIVWNSTNFISENSEVGQLLRVLVGYETTPSSMQLITYLVAFFIPVFISKSQYFYRLAYGENI